jgi:hypothetical protein
MADLIIQYIVQYGEFFPVVVVVVWRSPGCCIRWYSTVQYIVQ